MRSLTITYMVESVNDVCVVVRAYRQFPCGQIVPYGDIHILITCRKVVYCANYQVNILNLNYTDGW